MDDLKLNTAGKKRVLTEVAYYFLLSLIGITIISLIFQPPNETLRQAASALLFFTVAFYALRKERIDRAGIGLKFKPVLFSLLAAAAAAIIVFPIFSAGFHLYFSIHHGYDFTAAKSVSALSKNPSWWAAFAAAQVFLVGLPEEVLYRGYIQGRLNQFFDRRFTLFGARFGMSLFIASALFALGHFLLEPVPGRLAVFFPSLLFGYLRERTGALTAPVVFHGLSNVLLEFLYRGL
ncbi:MAG: CPBP family intramembrane metalloprotease [Deltaproteobacteria bacterium]|nr:CPBP family intramembrane metalloprotease [Deltaproteobacteria bacterium]